MSAFVGHPCAAPELPLADIGPLRPANDVAPDLLSSEYRPWLDRTADELRNRWNGGQPA